MGENELIAACLQGNGQEFKHIVDIYKTQVMALAMNILGNRQDAEDVCQETFIQVFRNLEHYDRQKSFRNWVFTILYRRCLDQLKKKRRFQKLFNKVKYERSHALQTGTPNPAFRKELSKALLKRLTPKERTALTLWANEGFTAAEISGVIRCSASTARVYLFNARKKIKSLLEKSHAALENS